jgi:predicted metal-binding membrane protein
MWPRVRDDRLLLAALAGIVALTWLSLWTWGAAPHSSHSAVGGSAEIVYLSLAGWTLMVAAMMLPTTFPLIALFHSFVRTRPTRTRLTAAVVAGYLWIWTLFGFVVFAGNQLLHGIIERSSWLDSNLWALGAGTLLLAGLYQFTSLKHMCLEKCRSPLAFIMEHWHGGRDKQEAFELGMRHGIFCIGCCWSLMLLMFVVSIGNLAWMLALGAVMAVEKNVSWGRRLTWPLGVLLVGIALVIVAARVSIPV